MSIGEPESRLDAWERREQPFIAVLPYVMLIISVILTVIIKGDGGVAAMLPDLGLAALTAAWMLWFFTLHPAWRERRLLMAAFFAGLIALTAVLVVHDPWFGFFSFTVYFYAFWLPAGWQRVLGVCAVALITAAIAIYIVIICINITIAGTLIWIGSEQNDRRKRAVAELRRPTASSRQRCWRTRGCTSSC